uniref:Nucleophosmin/nucleoplasmin 2 n=1 Tax=Accipiter nisus TaxID=211598 RepID=A0A8B9NFT4_9AVES
MESIDSKSEKPVSVIWGKHWGTPSASWWGWGLHWAALPPPPPPPPPNLEQPHSDTSLPTGCELSREQDSYTFQVPEEWQCEQQLALRTICLGEMARDEFHVVEIVLAEGGPRSPIPLATLKPSVLPMATLMGVELTPPVTFHLRAGSGPVYISGQHVSMMSNLSWDEEEEEEEEDAEEEEPAEESPKKPPKGQVEKKGNAAKVSTPLAGDAVCGGVPVPRGGWAASSAGTFPCPDPQGWAALHSHRTPAPNPSL